MQRHNKNNAYCIVRRRASREDRDAGIRAAFIELSVHLDLSLPPHLPYSVNLAFIPVVGGVRRVPVIPYLLAYFAHFFFLFWPLKNRGA